MKKKLLVAAALAGLSGAAFAVSTTTLTGTVRDFLQDGINFEGAITGLQTGAVASTLVGTAPTLTASGATHISNSGAGAFDLWYTKSTPGEVAPLSLTLTETAPGSGIYAYSNSAFFPIDNQLLGNQGHSHNYHFTFAIHGTFGYTPGAGQTFSFTGDDDVWVFFDKQLGIDLGGVHGPASASVNLDTLFGFGTPAAKPAGNYSFDFFFAERHLTGSNLNITTSLALTTAPPPIPEPSTYALMALGLAALGLLARTRKA